MLLSDLFSPSEYLIKPKLKESDVEKVIEPFVETAGEEKDCANEKAKKTAEEKSKVTK